MKLTKEIQINAPCRDVYRALTNSAEIIRYFPLDHVECDWQEGNPIVFSGPDSGQDIGVIDRLLPHSLFQFTYWNKNHGTENVKDNHITIRYELQESGDQTQLNLIQTNLPSQTYKDMTTGVWDYLLGELKKYLENK